MATCVVLWRPPGNYVTHTCDVMSDVDVRVPPAAPATSKHSEHSYAIMYVFPVVFSARKSRSVAFLTFVLGH